MPPRQDAAMKSSSDGAPSESFNKEEVLTDAVVRVVQPCSPPDAPSYLRCDSTQPFERPSAKSAAEINATELNLHLGVPWLDREKNRKVIKLLSFLVECLFSWWEQYFFRFYSRVPVEARRALTYAAWNMYAPLHQMLLGRRTGIHRDASAEYHALTTALWGARFFPVSVRRVRFGLSQLSASHPAPLESPAVEAIDEECSLSPDFNVPSIQVGHCRVSGLYLHHRPNNTSNTEATEYTLFWIYGGAFLGGDAAGNSGPADALAAACGMDVFIPTFRLAPEFVMDDFLWDVALAYRWLFQLRKKRGQNPSNILLFGCSSGAALCVRLVQYIAELERNEELLPPYVAGALEGVTMPAGVAIASPFVDFGPSIDPQGSFMQYTKHDLIVTEPVHDLGLPFLDTHMSGHRVEHSPLQHSFAGLPPLCVTVSEHEIVFDETVDLVNAARAAGVPVRVGSWKYMCHVFCFLGGFIPEGKQSMDFIRDWYREQITAKSHGNDQ